MNHAQFTQLSTLDRILEIGERHAKEYEYRPLLINGNDKVGHIGPEGIMWVTRGISYWSCPGKTTGPGGCDKGCYAHFMAYLSLNREADIGCGYTYLSFKDMPRLKRYLHRDLSAYKGFAGAKFVRVHDAGDYVSPEHVRMYYELAKLHPDVQFWGMSHSFSLPAIAKELRRLNKLPNVLIRESTDPVRQDSSGQAPQFHYDKKVAFVAWMGARAAEGTPAILCPSQFKRQRGTKQVRVTTCLQCQKCWKETGRPVGSYEH